MNILFVLGKYLPYRNAGMENYTHWIAGLLLKKGHMVYVATLDGPAQAYDFDGALVMKMEDTNRGFEEILALKGIDICHFQEYSAYGGIEIPMFELAKKNCKKVFFTFHLPYFTCYKNDFRYLAEEDCSVFNDPLRCSYCVAYTSMLEKYKINRTILKFIAQVSKLSFVRTKLESRIRKNQEPFHRLIDFCDTVFIYPDWFYSLIAENGFLNEKIKKIPYKNRIDAAELISNRPVQPTYKLLFAGRLQREKGLHLLTAALAELKDNSISLDVYGNVIDKTYFDACRKSYSFNFKGTVPLEELKAGFAQYDFLILPSMFPEMYSLIIKDAFNFGLPVIASDSKGNKDAITDGVNGFLFEYGSISSLSKVIENAYNSLMNGWKPFFGVYPDVDNEEKELLSYYK